MSLDFCSQVPAAAFAWAGRTSLHATVLIALVLLIVAIFHKWLSPAWGYGLWLLVVFRLLLPVAPPSPFSIFNVARFAATSPGSATLQVEIEPAKISVRPNAEPASLGTPVSDPARLDLS